MGSWCPNCNQLESPPSLWGGFLCICVIGTSKPLVIINYPKTFQSLFGFHKEVSWDPYCSLCISTSYLLLFNSLRYHCMLTILFFTALQKNLTSKRALNICVALWLTANRLTLNLSNTKSMLIGSNRRLHNISWSSLSIFDCELDSIDRF